MRTQKEMLTDLLQQQWTSNYQAQQHVKSSSGDRILRFIRKSPPEGYYMEQRKKDCEVYCLEYKLQKINSLKNEEVILSLAYFEKEYPNMHTGLKDTLGDYNLSNHFQAFNFTVDETVSLIMQALKLKMSFQELITKLLKELKTFTYQEAHNYTVEILKKASIEKHVNRLINMQKI